MRKILVVAMREYQAAVRTKAFIVSLVMMPVMMGGSILVQLALKDKVDTTTKKVQVLDYSGVLFDAIVAGAEKRNNKDIFKGEGQERKQVLPAFEVSAANVESTNPDDAVIELSERVKESDLLGFVIIGKDVVEPVQGERGSNHAVRYYSNQPTYRDFFRWLNEPVNDRLQELRFAKANLDRNIVNAATQRVRVASLGLVELDETGAVVGGERPSEIATIGVPLAMMMLMFMVVMVGAAPLMNSVLEEKMQRIAEVLLGSIPPFQLMLGKLIGMVGVSLTILTLYMIGAYVAIRQAGYGQLFPGHLVWWFVAYQALAVLMFGSMFVAIGAAVSDMKEAQSLMTPVMLVVVAPMFVWMNVVREPSSMFSLVISLFPPCTPMLMTMRQAVPPGIPLWQPLVGMAGVLLTTLFCVYVASRIFRVGVLMQGKGANIREMMRWVLRG